MAPSKEPEEVLSRLDAGLEELEMNIRKLREELQTVREEPKPHLTLTESEPHDADEP